jgi:AbrB family looped-hinge helix DNA binding protein
MAQPAIRLVRATYPLVGGQHIATLRMTTRGRMTIPKQVRELMKLQPGDRLEFERQPDGGYLITKARSKRARGDQ